MAKKATGRGAGTTRTSRKSSGSSSRSVARVSSSGGGRSSSQEGMGDAFIKLLQSPLVAELVAVAATAALAEHGFTSSGGSRGRRAGKAVKEAGKAAAAAIGRRLGNEIDEIRSAAKFKGGARG